MTLLLESCWHRILVYARIDMHSRWAICPNPGQKRAGVLAFLLFPFCLLVPKQYIFKQLFKWQQCSYKVLEQYLNMFNVAFYNYSVLWNNLAEAEGGCSSFWIVRAVVSLIAPWDIYLFFYFFQFGGEATCWKESSGGKRT